MSTQSFNYVISYGGGIGPDVWDAEMELSAVDIADAIAQATGRIEESGGWIFMVSQEDYPQTTREKLEAKLKESDAQRADLLAALQYSLEIHSVHARLGEIPRNGETPGNWEHICEAEKILKAAIAKATA